eukprot:TRINITY_DN12565_c0_g1_i1.p1 TRINITY_DN12565_c0_g1~~TRINITY_DN12565_c0_g1_i1.p1  ORF type:complete len:238 (-),score=28.46 TRINITY_DN12565_c0_g1_i1:117-803(-)
MAALRLSLPRPSSPLPIKQREGGQSLRDSTSPSKPESFVGSFEQNIMSGHMYTIPKLKFPGFMVDIGANGKNFQPPHFRRHIEVDCYDNLQAVDCPLPYVATIDLENFRYRISAKGLIQLTIFNPTKTPQKTFLVQYDITDMPAQTKTYIRQRIISAQTKHLYYAVQLRIISPQKRKYYLSGTIRVIFPHRIPDEEDVLRVSYHHPENPRFFSYAADQPAGESDEPSL